MMKESLSIFGLWLLVTSSIPMVCESFGSMSQSLSFRGMTTVFFSNHYNANTNDDDDDDELFDPLKSPHEYPNGTPGNSKKKQPQDDDDDWSPMKFSSVPNDFQGSNPSDYFNSFNNNYPQTSMDKNNFSTVPLPIRNNNKNNYDVLEDFDPRNSPHMYPNGIPSSSSSSSTGTPKMTESVTTAIVLMDHGSRKESSNAGLQQLATSYERYLNSPTIIVKAAHMEIAQPSIPTTIQQIITSYPNVSTIICHPYFLSSHGKHVTQDIPFILEQVQQSLSTQQRQTINIRTTPTTGFDSSLMIPLIDTIVQSHLPQQTPKLGGIFGDIQRMLEQED